MRRILVSSTKFDGGLHYQFGGVVVAEASDELRVYTESLTPVRSYRGDFPAKSHALRLFWPDRHWNLVMRWRPDWSIEDYYVNIATPATWNQSVVDWIDLDLDLILAPHAREALLDDADEFESHSQAWGYPPALVKRCWATIDDVKALMRRREFPFDGSLESWRPTPAEQERSCG
ncbi:MAG: DUF402 domain-containing protein [Tepidisphaeraceae bacterium]